MDEFAQALNRFALRVLRPGEASGLMRLTGGANMESWSFDWAGEGYVLRRAPSDALMAGRTYGHDVEAALVRLARAHGVRAPEVVGELSAADGLGTGYLMRRIAGEVRPDRIVGAPPTGLLAGLAGELGRIHAIPLAEVPAGLPAPGSAALVEELRVRFEDYGGDRPVLALALRWLLDHRPAEVDPVLLHGDFRLGNLLVDADGMAGVLDWELAHLGDRHQDLAFGCINSWRFGAIDRPAFGLGQFEELFEAYAAASGVAVEPRRFRWWLVYSTLWWGMCCLEMADIWRSGRDRSLERAVIGRRVSETEVDLLMLLEEDFPASERQRIPLPEPGEPRRQGEPSRAELLEAVGEWLAGSIKPGLQGRQRFEANVALNALGMLAREEASPYDRWLADDILAGRTSFTTPHLFAQLRAETLAKLAADQPKYSALALARARWGM